MKQPRVHIVRDDSDVFIAVDGRKIAKLGPPGTPQEETWISIEPGWQVFGPSKDGKLLIKYPPRH